MANIRTHRDRERIPYAMHYPKCSSEQPFEVCYCYYPHFIDDKSEAQRSLVTFPRYTARKWQSQFSVIKPKYQPCSPRMTTVLTVNGITVFIFYLCITNCPKA